MKGNKIKYKNKIKEMQDKTILKFLIQIPLSPILICIVPSSSSLPLPLFLNTV